MIGVLYSAVDLEPITVLDITPTMLQYMQERGRVTLPISEPPKVVPDPVPFTPSKLKTVTIWYEEFQYRGQSKKMFLTYDDDALMLDSVILPGQRKAWEENYQRGLREGTKEGVNFTLGILEKVYREKEREVRRRREERGE